MKKTRLLDATQASLSSIGTNEAAGMSQRRDLSADKRIRKTLEFLGERWTLLIVAEALSGHTHFDGFEKSLGVAPSTLAARLRLLVQIGVLERRGDRSNRLTYHLTEIGLALGPAFDLLTQWAKNRLDLPDTASLKSNVSPPQNGLMRGDMDAAV